MNKYNNNLNCSTMVLAKIKLKYNLINELDLKSCLINVTVTTLIA